MIRPEPFHADSTREEAARRRSFAWAVIAGKKRAQLAAELGYTANQVQAYLVSPGMGLLVCVWATFQSHRELVRSRQVFTMTKNFYEQALVDAYGVRARVEETLALMAPVNFPALERMTRDLCAELDRFIAPGKKGPTPLDEKRSRSAHLLAELVERVLGAQQKKGMGGDLDLIVATFRDMALSGLDPYLELKRPEEDEFGDDPEDDVFDEDPHGASVGLVDEGPSGIPERIEEAPNVVSLDRARQIRRG